MHLIRAALLVSLVAWGCSSARDSAGDDSNSSHQDGGFSGDAGIKEPGKSPDGGECGPDEYPCGPYGYAADNTIENVRVFGWHDTNSNGSVTDESARNIDLKGYFQDKSIKAIVVSASTEWSAPCNSVQSGLVTLYNNYAQTNAGVAFLEAIIEDKNRQPADAATVTRWATKYGIPFDVALDPSMDLQRYYDINAFPFAMVIRTSDMKIMWQGNGAAPQSIKKAVDAVLNEE